MGKNYCQNALNGDIAIGSDGTVIVSPSEAGLCRWNAINWQLLGASVSTASYGDIIWTNNDCTKMVTWSEWNKTIRYWRAEPGGTIHETSALSVPADIFRVPLK